MALAEKTVNEMIDQLGKGKPAGELARILRKHAETRAEICERMIKNYQARYMEGLRIFKTGSSIRSTC